MITTGALAAKAQCLREQVLELCIAAETGHVTSSFSCMELLVALYYGGGLRYRAHEPAWPERDRFLLSKGQASPALYAILADLGFFSAAKLATFCQPGGACGVHLQHDLPGVEITSGALGLGLGIGVGMALAARQENAPRQVVVLMGDGECHEGSVWEAALLAGHHRLARLVAIVDRNRLCATARLDDIAALHPLTEKWQAFGWDTLTVDGHDPAVLLPLMERMAQPRARPLAIIADTIKGKGIPFMEDAVFWHGCAPVGADAERARQALREREP